MTERLIEWLRKACGGYQVTPHAIFRKAARPGVAWPLSANSDDELAELLRERGNFIPLPKEPAALANVLEVSIVDHLLECSKSLPEAVATRGGERSYPDLELSAPEFGGGPYAVEIKVARRSASKRQTDSRISLYTGNTFFRYPDAKWAGAMRPFGEYLGHISVIIVYTLDHTSVSRAQDVEIIVHESWRLASKQRSSTTREYLGAVTDLAALREGRGEFATAEDFYKYWRNFDFKVGKAVAKHLDRLLAAQKAKK